MSRPPSPPSPPTAPVRPLEAVRGAAKWTLAGIGESLCRMPAAAFFVFVAVCAVLQNGVWVRPGVPYLQQMAADPFHNVLRDLPLKHYLYTSYLGLLIAHVTGTYRDVLLYAGLHLLELAALSALAFLWLRRSHGELVARVVGIVFLCSPAPTVLLTWLGIGDTLVFGFSSLLVLARGRLAAFALAALLGLSHAEQAAMIVGMLVVGAVAFDLETFGASRRERLERALSMIAGVAAAVAAVKLLFWARDFQLQEDRISYFLRRGPGEFLSRFARHPAATVYSFYLTAWVAVLSLLMVLRRHRPKAMAWFLVANGICLLIALSVFDITRVFALVAWPGLLVAILEARDRIQALARTRVTLLLGLGLLLAFVVPRAYVWDGNIHSTVRRYTYRLVTGKIDPKDPNFSFMPF